MAHAHTKTAGAALAPTAAAAPVKTRFMGVDVVRGVALLSMLAANVFVEVVTDDGTPTLSGMTVIGRSEPWVTRPARPSR